MGCAGRNVQAFRPLPGIGNKGCGPRPTGCTLLNMNPHNPSGPGHDHTDVDWEVMADQLENSGDLQLPVLHRTATHLRELLDRSWGAS